MNLTELPTEDLIAEYFETDHRLNDYGGTAGRLSDMATMMDELESRGVCPRDLRAPEWYTAATDSRRGIC
jgi:hypothetical protein